MKRNIQNLQYNIIILMLLFAMNGQAQDIHFSQFQAAPIFLNPAFAGEFGGDLRLSANFRNQWQTLAPYTTALLSVDTKIQVPNSFSHFGIAATVSSDQAGDLDFTTNFGQVSLAYNMYLGSTKKADFYTYIGAQYGRIVQRFDQSKARLESPDQELFWNSGIGYNDFSVGMVGVVVLPSFFVHGGLALSHLNEPEVSFNSKGTDIGNVNNKELLYKKLGVHLAGHFALNQNRIALLPAIQYLRQHQHQSIVLGMSLKFQKLQQRRRQRNTVDWSVGLHHRWQDALILSTQFSFAKQYNFSISYDLPLSQVRNPSNSYGAVEVALSFTLPQKRKQGDFPRQGGGLIQLKCPSAGARPNESNPWFRTNGVGM